MYPDERLTTILLPVVIVIGVGVLIGHVLNRKQADPLQKALNAFGLVSIAYGIIFLVLLFSLPLILKSEVYPKELHSLDEALKYQQETGRALIRIREVVYCIIFISIFWLSALFRFLKTLTTEFRK